MATEVEVAEIPDCDIHKLSKGQPGVPAEYDGATTIGPWAYMCGECFMLYGQGLGTGVGQRLILKRGEKGK